MSKDPYRIVDTKPSWSSRLGSGAVALGSVATAIVITVPGLPGYQLLSEANAVISGATNTSGLATSTGETDVIGTGQSAAQTSELGATGTLSSAGISSPAKAQTVSTGGSSSTGQPPLQLSLPGVASGNTSSPTPTPAGGWTATTTSGGSTATGNTTSPTPTASGGSTANTNTGGSTATGNTTSPTPGGSQAGYEEEEDEEEEEGEDD